MVNSVDQPNVPFEHDSKENIPEINPKINQSVNKIVSPIMYKIKDNTNKTCGYIIGTVHIGDLEAKNLSPKIVKRITKSKNIGVEVDVTSEIAKSELPIFMKSIVSSIKEEMKHLTLQEVDEILNSYKQCFGHLVEVDDIFKNLELIENSKFRSMENKENLKRTLLSGMVVDLLRWCFQVNESKDISVEHGIDAHIIKTAKEMNKGIFGLETYSDQLETLTNLSNREKLDKTTPFEILKGLKELLTAWKQGDEKSLIKLYLKIPGKSTSALKKRNIAWANKIDEYLRKASTDDRLFIAVGTLHLFQDENLRELLEKKGWNIQKA